jgi:hypothetical protein
MMALSKATLVVVDTFCTQDLVSLVENMKTVVMMGQYRQYLLVCLVKVVRVVACRQGTSGMRWRGGWWGMGRPRMGRPCMWRRVAS